MRVMDKMLKIEMKLKEEESEHATAHLDARTALLLQQNIFRLHITMNNFIFS